jgi:DNA-binding transcriptional MocR family regulator
MRKDKNPPAYLQVARDIAGRIASGEIQEGERFSGRSLMSSQYNVSPETIRRALGLLAEMDVLSMRQNVGAVVKSRERAARYVDHYGEAAGMPPSAGGAGPADAGTARAGRAHRGHRPKAGRHGRALSVQRRHADLRVHRACRARIAGQTIAQSAFRTETGATILAVRRGAQVILSPGPDEKIAPGDVLVIVCGVLLVPVVSEFICRTV